MQMYARVVSRYGWGDEYDRLTVPQPGWQKFRIST